MDSNVKNLKQADLYIFKYIVRLLGVGEYSAAALVTWGIHTFDPRPSSVKSIWNEIEVSTKCLIMSAGSVGKSYSAMAWIILDWLRDPEFTSIKVISTTATHASLNTFSTLVRLHRQAVVKLPGIVTTEYIGLDAKEKKSGIALVAIPIGDDGRGRLKGFHPDPRPKPHPVLGPSSRIRLAMDECEDAPIGIWEGVNNILLTSADPRSVKVFGLFNPKNPTSPTAKSAMPPEGWDAVDIDKGYRGSNRWVSKEGWNVLRIDAKYTENVKLKRQIYPGLVDHIGFRQLELRDGGNSIDYWSQGRGLYPPEGAVGVLVSGKLINDARGEFIFVGRPISAAGVDTALDGRDNCVLTVGRTGMASGFTPKNGRPIRFKEPRSVLQIDQQFILPKGDTKKMGDAIMTNCMKLGVSPEYCCIDSTGNGSGVYSYLRAIWSEDVQGIDFNAKATEIKIMEQDQYDPVDLYDGIVSEVWFAFAKWLEFGLLGIAPGVRRDPLESELTGRRYVFGKGRKLKVEKKDDFKKRMGGKSPDFADSATIILQGVRQRESIMGTMLDDDSKPLHPSHSIPQHDETAEVEWLAETGV